VHPDYLLYAGGNYNFGFGAGEDHSVWRLMPFDGARACAWAARGASGLLATADDADGCPPLVADAFGEGSAGLHFDGSTDQLRLAEPDLQPAGRSVFWVARAPALPSPYLGFEDTYAPAATVVGGAVATGMLGAGMSEAPSQGTSPRRARTGPSASRATGKSGRQNWALRSARGLLSSSPKTPSAGFGSSRPS
jgi:hypothetical protein